MTESYKAKVAYRVKVKEQTVTETQDVTKKRTVTGCGRLAFVNKYGYTFILDRETGKPLTDIKEVPVPQSTAPEVNVADAADPQGDRTTDDPLATDGSERTARTATDADAHRYPFAQATAPDGKPYKDQVHLRPVHNGPIRPSRSRRWTGCECTAQKTTRSSPAACPPLPRSSRSELRRSIRLVWWHRLRIVAVLDNSISNFELLVAGRHHGEVRLTRSDAPCYSDR